MNAYDLLTSGRRGLVANQIKAPLETFGFCLRISAPTSSQNHPDHHLLVSQRASMSVWQIRRREQWFLLLCSPTASSKAHPTLILGQDLVVRVSVKETELIRLAKIKPIGSTQNWQWYRETGNLSALVGMEIGRIFFLEGFGVGW